MPFIRVHGNQLAVVHGSRRDGTVVQEVLFTLYSRAEAREALGQGSSAGAHWFERMLEDRNPGIRFDFGKLRAAIAEKIEHLPETYDHLDARLRRDFRGALVAFARQLMLADPQDMDVAAEVIEEHRGELEAVQKWLEWRMRMARERKPSQFSADNPFLWRYQGIAQSVPHEADEEVHDLYERGEHEKVLVRARLMTEAFPHFADGHNLLGLVALDREAYDDAIAHFQHTVEVGQSLLPRRVAKSAWWNDLDTRPYIRGLGNLVIALNRAGRHAEALATCDELARCQDELNTNAHRAPVLMSLARYAEAADAYRTLLGLWPEHGYDLSFALASQGLAQEARVHLLHAILCYPRTAQRLLRQRLPKATNRDEWLADERARNIELDLDPYLKRERRRAIAPLRALMNDRVINAAATEVSALLVQRAAERGRDRSAFDRLREIQTEAHARRLLDAGA